MARRCAITGKAPGTGNLRSHSNRATKRRFFPNLIKRRILDPFTDKYVRKTIATSTLRTLMKEDRTAVKKAREMMKV